MPLDPFGSRVHKILSQPPKEISPGEAVSMYVREHPQIATDFQDSACAAIREWLTLCFRGTWSIKVQWSEIGLLYEVFAYTDESRVNGERKVARARVYSEQVNELSADMDAWTSLLEWVAICLKHDVGHANVAQVANAVSRLNEMAQAAERKRLDAEEQAAIESIKRSAEAS